MAGTEESRHALCVQLTRNALTLAAANIGNDTFADLYFNQPIVRPARNLAGSSVFEGEPAAGEKYLVTDQGFNTVSRISLTNTGEVSLKFYLAWAVADEVPATAMEIAAGASMLLSPSQLGDPDATCLMCYNPSESMSGSFISEVKEKVK